MSLWRPLAAAKSANLDQHRPDVADRPSVLTRSLRLLHRPAGRRIVRRQRQLGIQLVRGDIDQLSSGKSERDDGFATPSYAGVGGSRKTCLAQVGRPRLGALQRWAGHPGRACQSDQLGRVTSHQGNIDVDVRTLLRLPSIQLSGSFTRPIADGLSNATALTGPLAARNRLELPKGDVG